MAATGVSAAGTGSAALADALKSGRSGLVRNDFPHAQGLDTWIGPVTGIEEHRLPEELSAFDCRNNRLADLALAQDGFLDRVAALRARVGAAGIGVFLGTTTSGMLDTELQFSRNELGCLDPQRFAARHSLYGLADFVRRRLELEGPALVVSTACSSSAKVFATAARYIARGLCSAAVVGGADSLSLTTLHGFASLDLLSPSPCRPCAVDRDGISIGEAAAFFLLEPMRDSRFGLLGWGESTDAYHASTPHPDGTWAAAAMQAAIDRAGIGPEQVDYVNLHGTASPNNDLAEDKAVVHVLGKRVPVSSTKGCTGHTLGAAGALEALICLLALEEQWVPGTVGCERVDPALQSSVVRKGRPGALRAVVSNSFGFGGTNCSLVLGEMRC